MLPVRETCVKTLECCNFIQKISYIQVYMKIYYILYMKYNRLLSLSVYLIQKVLYAFSTLTVYKMLAGWKKQGPIREK